MTILCVRHRTEYSRVEEFDPTNARVGGRNLIRVAVAGDASQAAPLAGAFIGTPDDFLRMNVSVQVTAE